MNDEEDLAPIEIVLSVAAPIEHAFATFVDRIATWWPRDHLADRVDGVPIIEPGDGGRVYERTGAGHEVDWGTVVGWEPPHRLALSWFIGATAEEATDVIVTFSADGPGTTTLRLVHDGWDRLGHESGVRRTRNLAGWDDVLGAFTAHLR